MKLATYTIYCEHGQGPSKEALDKMIVYFETEAMTQGWSPVGLRWNRDAVNSVCRGLRVFDTYEYGVYGEYEVADDEVVFPPGTETAGYGFPFPGVPEDWAISTGLLDKYKQINVSCKHEWVESPGFSRMYKDCKHCKAKWEDVPEHERGA